MTINLFLDWFDNHFVPEVETHLRNIGQDFKVILFLDNASQHSHEELIGRHPNVRVVFLPPNTTCFIQPLDQAINRSFKCKYMNRVVDEALVKLDHGTELSTFWKEFNLRRAIYHMDKAWTSVTSSTVQKAWHNLFPQLKSESSTTFEVQHEETARVCTHQELNQQIARLTEASDVTSFDCDDFSMYAQESVAVNEQFLDVPFEHQVASFEEVTSANIDAINHDHCYWMVPPTGKKSNDTANTGPNPPQAAINTTVTEHVRAQIQAKLKETQDLVALL